MPPLCLRMLTAPVLGDNGPRWRSLWRAVCVRPDIPVAAVSARQGTDQNLPGQPVIRSIGVLPYGEMANTKALESGFEVLDDSDGALFETSVSTWFCAAS